MRGWESLYGRPRGGVVLFSQRPTRLMPTRGITTSQPAPLAPSPERVFWWGWRGWVSPNVVMPLVGIRRKVSFEMRRGERQGGGDHVPPRYQPDEQDAGDHKGPPFRSPPLSPLRTLMGLFFG